MLLASKAALPAIVFILLSAGVSRPRPMPAASGPNLNKEEPAVWSQNEVGKMQDTLHDKGHYRGKVDGVFGLRTRASIREFQKAENLPVTGQLDSRTAGKLGISLELRGETWQRDHEG